MSILIDSLSRVLVQGITGRTGSFFSRDMLGYGTRIIAGVTPGKGGMRAGTIPVFNSVSEALAEAEADVSALFVPGAAARDSIFEAIACGIKLIVYPGENMPIHDMMDVTRKLKESSCRMIGPNTPGIISPGEAKIGFMPSCCYRKGNVGVVSRSGSLSYEITSGLTRAGIGQSTAVGIGGDPVKGMGFVEVLALFEEDRGTQAVVLIGEIGGGEEEAAAAFIARGMKKPVIAFIAGRYSPANKKMGHAGAIISDGLGTYEAKIEALKGAGVRIAQRPFEIPALVKEALALPSR